MKTINNKYNKKIICYIRRSEVGIKEVLGGGGQTAVLSRMIFEKVRFGKGVKEVKELVK